MSSSPGKARLAILFSGGIDSAALCYFADRYCFVLIVYSSINLIVVDSHLPRDEAIDLLNVAFENPRKIKMQLDGNLDVPLKHLKRERKKQMNNSLSTQNDAPYMVPDRVSGLEELEELRLVCPGRTWNFVGIAS